MKQIEKIRKAYFRKQLDILDEKNLLSDTDCDNVFGYSFSPMVLLALYRNPGEY